MAYMAWTKKPDHSLVGYFDSGWPSSDVDELASIIIIGVFIAL